MQDAGAFDADRLRRVDTYLQAQVDSSRIAGAVGLVMRDGKVVYQRAVGWADKESGRRMTADAMFRIASQTKALTSVAIMPSALCELSIASSNTCAVGLPNNAVSWSRKWP